MMRIGAIVSILLLSVWTAPAGAQQPALPDGLSKNDRPEEKSGGPSLPAGLVEKEPSTDQPSLPPGLGQSEPEPAPQAAGEDQGRWRVPSGLSGFFEVRAGSRVKEDPVQDDAGLAEARIQLSYDRSVAELLPRGRFRLTTDLLFDALDDDRGTVDLDSGEGFVDLRELWVSLTPLSFMDAKAGRQVLTWGTGNLIFLNDLFPKDYRSFFLGRDLDYLKAPSDAVTASLYSK